MGVTPPRPGSRWRHVRRGTIYEVLHVATAQDSLVDLREGQLVVVYRGDDGRVWARDWVEFRDGRFEEIVSHTPARP